jgi:hypothetical protein
MANTIAEVYVQTYERIVRQLAQQMDSRLRRYVTERGTGGINHNWERLASVDASKKETRLQVTPVVDAVWSRRVSLAQTWDVGDSTEQEDVVQMIVDPNSNLAYGQGMAMKRAFDDSIIVAATGTALDGDGATNALPASQIVGDYTGVISLDVVTQVTEIFLDNDIDPSEQKVFVIGPNQQRTLLQIAEATNNEYARKALQDRGIVENWMGYTWIVSTRLLHPIAGQTTCFAMTKRALGLQVNRDISARIAEDPSISFAWRIYCFATFGTVRVEDEHLVQFSALNAT